MALTIPKDLPPFSSGSTLSPLNGLTALKLGPPLKGNLKRSQQRTYIPPSFEDNKTMKTSKDDIAELDAGCLEKRSIKWLDDHGKELIEVKEFEPSDGEDSDDEHEDLFASCTCVIQ